MNKEAHLYDQRQLRLMIKIINKYKPKHPVIELMLSDLEVLLNLLNLNDQKWLNKFKSILNYIFEKNEWIIITLDRDKQFFHKKNELTEKDIKFINESYKKIENEFPDLKDHIKTKIDISLSDEEIEYKY